MLLIPVEPEPIESPSLQSVRRRSDASSAFSKVMQGQPAFGMRYNRSCLPTANRRRKAPLGREGSA
jgi:hypothetical protein